MISRRGTRTSGASSGVTKILREAGSGPVVTAGSVVSGLERMFMASSLWVALNSSGFWLVFEPRAHPRVGLGVLGDVADDGDRIGAGGKNLARLFELDAADRDQWNAADALFPFGDFWNALRGEAHRFQRGRKDRPERDVIRLGAQRGFEFLVVMGGEAERETRIADCLEIGVNKVLLAEMQMFCSGHDRRAPVIIDHEFCRRAFCDFERVADDLQRFAVVEVFRAQLDRADAKRGQARDPTDAVDHGIEAIRIRHARTVSQRLEWKGRRSRGLPSSPPQKLRVRPRRLSGTRAPSRRDRCLWRSQC